MSEILAAGFDEATVKRVIRLIDFNEYKRRQAAPGLKVTSKAFGVGQARSRIAQKYQVWVDRKSQFLLVILILIPETCLPLFHGNA